MSSSLAVIYPSLDLCLTSATILISIREEWVAREIFFFVCNKFDFGLQ